MSVDMYERRFKDELRKLPTFAVETQRNARVWREGFPAWRALFSSLCLWGHSTGYRLPSFEDFYQYCRRAYTHDRHPRKDLYKPYFEGSLLPGMRQRVGVWYQSGMAETHLYACLVEAIEDKSKCGVVLYDPRADWKLKADVVVVIRGRSLRVSAFEGEESGRPTLEARRDEVEHDRKRNTPDSAHWGNKELEMMKSFTIARASDADTEVVNGVPLFSLSAVNRLLAGIYTEADVRNGYQFPAA